MTIVIYTVDLTMKRTIKKRRIIVGKSFERNFQNLISAIQKQQQQHQIIMSLHSNRIFKHMECLIGMIVILIAVLRTMKEVGWNTERIHHTDTHIPVLVQNHSQLMIKLEKFLLYGKVSIRIVALKTFSLTVRKDFYGLLVFRD